MASPIDKQLQKAVEKGDRIGLKTLLDSDEIQRNGNLGKMAWYWNQGGAPLHQAAADGQDDMIKMLIEAGIHVNCLDIGKEDSATALHWAVMNKKALTAKLLLELGADPMLQGNYKTYVGTAQDWAITEGFTEEFENILKEHAATVTIATTSAAASDPQVAKALINKLNTMSDEEETLTRGKKIQSDIKAKEAEMLSDDIEALRADRDFKTDEELKKMRDNLGQMKDLVEAFKNANTNNDEDANVCPICFKVPEKVFTCSNDDGECDVWYCSACMDDLTKCPKCRAEFHSVPPRRSIQLEKRIRRRV